MFSFGFRIFNKILPFGLSRVVLYRSPMSALLIVSCSAKKSCAPGLLPALERYDGPHFRVLRKQLRGQYTAVQTLILSAEFGLIDSRTPIPNYDRKLTASRVVQLRDQVIKNFDRLTKGKPLDRVFIFGGRLYLSLLSERVDTIGKRVRVRVADGRPGERLAQLKKWLISLGES